MTFKLGGIMHWFRWMLCVPAGFLLAAAPPAVDKKQIGVAYTKLPLSFEANQGQTDQRVRYLARGSGYTLFLTPQEAVVSLVRQERRKPHELPSVTPKPAWVTNLRMRLKGANPAPEVTGEEPLAARSHYFIGNDPDKWRTGVPSFGRVKYQAVYPGIDLVYYGNQSQLEYDFVVAPGADPRLIRLEFDGARKLRIDRRGDLVLEAGPGELRFHKPVVYQDISGSRKSVAGRFVRHGASQVGFALGAYEASLPLIIDPVLSYSTFLGGSNDMDVAYGVAADSSGNVYVAGRAGSTNFPITAGSFQPAALADANAFVAKLNPSVSGAASLVYSTYLGGSCHTVAFGVAVDPSGNIYVSGITCSSDFPTTPSAYNSAHQGGGNDVFFAKLNPAVDGAGALLYSTLLGGSSFDVITDLAVDSAGHAYLTGYTLSTDYPVTIGAFQTAPRGFIDGIVIKLDPAASGTASLVYSTFLGGSSEDILVGIAVDASGNVYVTGYTFSTNFPTAGAFQATKGGGYDALLTKLNPAAYGAASLLYSTYLGGFSSNDFGRDVAVDSSGKAWVAGSTDGNFPTTAGAFQVAFGGSRDAFVTRLNPGVSGPAGLEYSTYLGGGSIEEARGIAVDASGKAIVVGWTTSDNFPVTAGAIQGAFGGSNDAFVSRIDPVLSGAPSLAYSTYLGGSSVDYGFAAAVDSAGNAYAVGQTESANFPTAGAFQSSHGGGGTDAFLAKIGGLSPTDASPPVITPNVSPGANPAGWHNTNVTVSWTVTDPETGIASSSGCGATTLTVDTSPLGVIYTCSATNGAGLSDSKSVTVKRDTVLPVITATHTPPANGAGWNNSDVTKNFSCSDALSGVASCSTPQIITAQGSTTVTGTAVDVAGNSASHVQIVKIDKTAPSMACSVAPNPLWPPDHRLVAVTSMVTVTDPLSGPNGFALTSAVSNEPDNGLGDGDQPFDIQGWTTGTPDTSGQLRAERSGTGNGRIYTLNYQGMDLAGNTATCAPTVVVPISQGN